MPQSFDISNGELVVLKVLWEESPLLSADVVKRVQQTEAWHEKTIKTLLNRLVNKEAIGYQKDGRAYLYHPLIDEAEYQRFASTRLVDNIFSGRIAGLVAGFAEQRPLKNDDIESLRAIIASYDQKQGDSHD